ncbi:MAG: DUF6011 domain-containing protein [Sandaracinaceae bacterium]|nr:DUF6011 domain-containing protein [Sandaracinaceae bacterium]
MRTPVGAGVVVWATLDRVRVAFAPGQVKTYLASAASAWTTISDGSSGSPRDRLGRMVARLMREGLAQCEACGALLSDPVSRAVGRGPECRRSTMARQRGTMEQRIAGYLCEPSDEAVDELLALQSDDELALILVDNGWTVAADVGGGR